MADPTCFERTRSPYCSDCDLIVGLDGLHVIEVVRDAETAGLVVMMESAPGVVGCPECGVVARSHGRRMHELIDIPAFGRPVRLRWRKRTWRCVDPDCPRRGFTEQDPNVAAPRALLTTRACWWAIEQLRSEHASIAGLARQLATTWRTVWTSIRPLLETLAADESRFAGVTRLGVDEHIWHHTSTRPIAHGGQGPKELTGMGDLTPDKHGHPRVRLLDLVPGRSGRPTPTGSPPAGSGSGPGSKKPPWTRSAATRTPSMTTSTTPPPSSMPFTW